MTAGRDFSRRGRGVLTESCQVEAAATGDRAPNVRPRRDELSCVEMARDARRFEARRCGSRSSPGIRASMPCEHPRIAAETHGFVPVGRRRCQASIMRRFRSPAFRSEVESPSGELRRLLARPWSFQAPRRAYRAAVLALVDMVPGWPGMVRVRNGGSVQRRGAERSERSNLPGRVMPAIRKTGPSKTYWGAAPCNRLCRVLSIVRAAWRGVEKRVHGLVVEVGGSTLHKGWLLSSIPPDQGEAGEQAAETFSAACWDARTISGGVSARSRSLARVCLISALYWCSSCC
jgi:hypothetical protein